MFQSKTDPSRKFGSAFRGRKFDSMHAGPSAEHEAKENPEFEAGEKEGKEEVHPVVAEHGKAHKVHIKHDHAGNKHHVTSMHEDGHVNESDHASAQEAHDEGAKLAGAEAPSQESEEQGNPAASAISSMPQGME